MEDAKPQEASEGKPQGAPRKRAPKKATKLKPAQGRKRLPTLSVESKGNNVSAVLRLQALLGLFRIYLRPDGRFGPQTERAVVEFQQMVGLPQDGVVDEKTWEMLLHYRLETA